MNRCVLCGIGGILVVILGGFLSSVVLGVHRLLHSGRPSEEEIVRWLSISRFVFDVGFAVGLVMIFASAAYAAITVVNRVGRRR